MKYKTTRPSLLTPPVTGALVGAALPIGGVKLIPWQPSTWPPAPAAVDADFIATLKTIIQQSILDEIDNVIGDAKAHNGNLEHRGHVVAIALMCALDAISAYGNRGSGKWKGGAHIEKFVRSHFPREYHRYASAICQLYRNCLIHSWNLFEVTLLPGSDPVRVDGTLSFGLLNFRDAMHVGVNDFLVELAKDRDLQRKTLVRYEILRKTAKP